MYLRALLTVREACDRRTGFAEELPGRRRQNRASGYRGGFRPVYQAEEGYRHCADQPTRISHNIDARFGRLSTNSQLTQILDRRAHKTPSRPVQRSFPQLARDPLKGPPVRSREGQCDEKSQEAVWRVDYEGTLESWHGIQYALPNARSTYLHSGGGRGVMTHGYVEKNVSTLQRVDVARRQSVGSIDRIPKYAK